MPELLRMPEVATGTESAVLSGWAVAEAQPYAAGAAIAMIETAKAAVDLEADAAGVIVRYLAEPGDEVRVGDPIALTAGPDENVPDPDQALAALGVGAVAPAPPAAPETPSATSVPATATATATDTATATAVGSEGGPAARHRVFSSPLARRLAGAAGLALATVPGSGPGGRVLRRDVEAALAGRHADGAGRPPAPAVGTRSAAGTSVPHSPMRRLIATRLGESTRTIPHFSLRGTARVDRLLALRAELNDGADHKVSINDMIVKAVARTHRAVPAVNVIWGPDSITRLDEVDVAVAIATPDGLVTPVLRGVDRMSIGDVAAGMRDFVERARDGRLKQGELEGGSITVTNLGMYGTEEFTAIINPPQSSILAVGAAAPEPVVDADGALRVATVVHVRLSADHRPIDGALAAEWMRAFRDLLEHPARILA